MSEYKIFTSDQLKAFRRRKTHFALVVDEYGEVEGMVTLEDLSGQVDSAPTAPKGPARFVTAPTPSTGGSQPAPGPVETGQSFGP